MNLYHKNRSSVAPGLGMITKLKYEVYLTSYSKMRVDLAAQVRSSLDSDFHPCMLQVLSNEVACGIRSTVGEVAEETAKFAEYFDKFFDCLNVSNPSVGKKSKNTFKNPYRKYKDEEKEDFRPKVGHINYT